MGIFEQISYRNSGRVPLRGSWWEFSKLTTVHSKRSWRHVAATNLIPSILCALENCNCWKTLSHRQAAQREESDRRIVGKQVTPTFPKVKLVLAIVYQAKLTLKVWTENYGPCAVIIVQHFPLVNVEQALCPSCACARSPIPAGEIVKSNFG